ncbi:MAG: DegT/DnrJ/EryC1/StrS family aminotransferase [Candidatus Omnitrophota bacterium]
MTRPKEIPFSIPFIDQKEINEVVHVLRGKWITSGPEVTKFERKVQAYLGVSTAVAVSSATAALEICLAVHGVGPGDDVLTTAYTFASTAIVIVHRGASPVLVDVETDTFNLDPVKIEEFIRDHYVWTDQGLRSPQTGHLLRGILPVHFGGQAAEMDRINAIAQRFNLFVVEDAAHAIGAVYRGTKIGKSPNLVCFSFYSNKNLTTGEGGMIVTDNQALEQKLRMYALHGISKSAVERYKTGLPLYDIVYPGYKANLTDIQAALGVVQIQKLDRITRLRNQAARWYDAFLKTDRLQTPVIRDHNYSARHLYPILLSPELKPFRDDMILQLRKKRIYPSIHFIPVHFHSFFNGFFKEQLNASPLHLPVTEDLFYREISLPLFPDLTKDDVKVVSDALKGIIDRLIKKHRPGKGGTIPAC